jgi:RNA polymerase sigma factor (TIGR02999 family)
MTQPQQEPTRAPAVGGEQVRELLARSHEGQRHVIGKLYTVLYAELRTLAHAHLRQISGGVDETLCTTALVNESYLRLAGGAPPRADEREQFLALASTAMRHVLVDHARARGAQKRGGGYLRLTLHDDIAITDGAALDLLALDDALEQLGRIDQRMVSVVECRFFGGLSLDETARALQISASTVERSWRRARAWLQHMLTADGTLAPDARPNAGDA